jgi:hypothetical protein
LASRRILLVGPDGERLRKTLDAVEPDAEVVQTSDPARALGRAAGRPALDVAVLCDADGLGAVALASTIAQLVPGISMAIVAHDHAAVTLILRRMGLTAAVLRAPIAPGELAEFLQRTRGSPGA